MLGIGGVIDLNCREGPFLLLLAKLEKLVISFDDKSTFSETVSIGALSIRLASNI
jgi:hypothetical protein